MQIFDLEDVQKGPGSGQKSILLYEKDGFKLRSITLNPGDDIPPCEMASSVIFHVLAGSVEITSNAHTASIKEGQCVVSEPATISMFSTTGARLLGIQIRTPPGMTND